ncbi:SET-binding protein-like [Conger conger]|uniref:SET-binding protein-like n=1 Tax=Conger conger TaxID=82655 RepID=UPI002A59A8E2|nr:SET-binding protein-like [Conger conger]
MEPGELTGFARPNGDKVDLCGNAGMHNAASLPEGLLGSQTVLAEAFPMSGEQVEPEGEDALSLGGDEYALSNQDSEKWVHVDGIEEQEFSIKEASFSQGSLKLKIQTTKRAKKLPKSLENYICSPEIRITAKQPGEQKAARLSKTSLGGEEEEEDTTPKKKVYESSFQPVIDQDASNHLGESMKPKPQPKNSLLHQVDWIKPLVGRGSSQGNATDVSESKRESALVNRSSLPDLTNGYTKSQQRKVTGSSPSCSFASEMLSQNPGSQIRLPSAANMPPATQTDSSLTRLTTSKRDRGLLEVTELVFGNIKRKYGRKDSIRNLASYNSEFQTGKKAEKDPVTETPDKAKEKPMFELEKTAGNLSGRTETVGKKTEKEVKHFPEAIPAKAEEYKVHPWRKRQFGESLKDPIPLANLTGESSELNRKADRGFSEPKPPNRIAPRTSQSVENRHTEAGQVAMTELADLSKNKLRKHPVRRANAPRELDDPTDTKLLKPKVNERWSHLKSKSSSHQTNSSNLKSAVLEPPSAYPITPSSPLYTNTDSLTVITPIKKKRGRPKKQPLLTVETIHEGTSSSPISPISGESLGTLQKRRTQNNFSELQVAKVKSHSYSNQLNHYKNTGKLGVWDKNNLKRTKMAKMKHILNEILSCSANSNLTLKSRAPVSNAVSTVASKIEAHLGKQINISKRGTIYIGKKRGRKPKAELQAQQDQHKVNDKHSVSSQFENPAVPSNPQPMAAVTSPGIVPLFSAPAAGPGGILCHINTETGLQELKTMPNLQAVSALPTKAPKGFPSSHWKLSPPRLMTNSPSHLSEVTSLKEVTLSPISESHSEETIPSDSGIGTDNNSTSDQAEKGPASRRRYSFDFCSFEPAEAAALAPSRTKRGHCQKHVDAATVKAFLSQENLKKQKHRRKRKGIQRRDDLQFLADIEELIDKFQVFCISHRTYNFCRESSYPSIFRLNFNNYYPMPYLPFDPLHYLRRNSEIKSKKRRGRPTKANEPMSKMPFIQGFSYPFPSGNYYAPYAMPYTSMPIATSMVNLGYYGQYPAPLYLSHSLGATASPFMRPVVPQPQFHSSAHVKLATAAKHKIKLGSQQVPSTGMEDAKSLLVAPTGGGGNLPNVRLHKRKHKHKHKHTDDQLSRSERDDLGGLFSGSKNQATLPKPKDKLRNQQSPDALLRSSRNLFEVDNLSTLSLSDSQQWKCTHEQEELVRDLHAACSYRHSKRILTGKDMPSDLPGRLQPPQEAQAAINNKSQSMKGFAVYRQQNIVPFLNSRVENMQQSFHCPSPSLEAHSHPAKKIFQRNEMEGLHCEVQKMCAFSKILSTKNNLDHVNKILKAKRLQRQARTGNNVVKRRRGRPRKNPLPLDEEPVGQMPVLERCLDLPGRRMGHTSQAPEPLEFSNQASIVDAIESVVHKAHEQPKIPPTRGRKQWSKTPEEVRSNRPRR